MTLPQFALETDCPAGLNRGKAALEFDRPNQAEEAVRCMDGGILDGSVLKVQVSSIQAELCT